MLTDSTVNGSKPMNLVTAPVSKPSADASLVEDMKLAASKMLGEARRSFQAAMAIKYCGGRARQAEAVFGWNRRTVELGLHERRTGIICLGCHEAFCGNTLWEEKYPEAAKSLWAFVQTQSQQDPTFRTTLSYTRLTAAQALKQLREVGIAQEELPSPSTMAEILNRNGYRLRPVIKAKPQKKSLKQTTSLPTSTKRTGNQSWVGK
jgi:hypothetical protein